MNNTNNSKSLLLEIFAKNSYGLLNLINNAKSIPKLLNSLLVLGETEQVYFYFI
jgi:hypothetical protein